MARGQRAQARGGGARTASAGTRRQRAEQRARRRGCGGVLGRGRGTASMGANAVLG
jgi:hypothetical protein